MALRRLIYASRATVDSATQVRVLVGQAQVRNRRCNVTGALGYTGQHFIQVLEGDASAVTGVISSIERDTRHTSIRVVSDTPAERRIFSGWDMYLVESLDAADVIRDLLVERSPTEQIDLRALFDQIRSSLNQ